MAIQARADLFGMQGSLSMGQTFQSVQTVSASIRVDPCRGLSFNLARSRSQLTWIALNKKKSPVSNCLRASKIVAQESCDNSPREGFLRVKELPISSTSRNGDIKSSSFQPPADIRHSQSTSTIHRPYRPPKQSNGEQQSTVPKSPGFTRKLTRHVVQLGHGSRTQNIQNASTTSEAMAMLQNHQQQGITIDSHTFIEVLRLCSKLNDLVATRQVHDCMLETRMDKNPYVANTLMSVYIKCGRLRDARRVFDGLERTTALTWSIMIGGYASSGRTEDAMRIFNLMRKGGAQPSELTCLTILKACTSPLALKWGKEVHAYLTQAGLESVERVGTSLIRMYAKCGCITEARRVFETLINPTVVTSTVMIGAYAANGSVEEARQVFDRMEKRDIITWNILIGAYAESGAGAEAYQLFLRMKEEGFRPDKFTYVGILNASASAGALEWVKDVHSHALKAGLETNLRVGTDLVHMYAKCGSIEDARLVFDRMGQRDVVTWNIIIGAYAESGSSVEAYKLFLQMKREGFIPDVMTYINILNASATAGALEWVKEIHKHAVKAGLELELRVSTALVHVYGKIGSIDDARLLFDRMERRDVVTWTSMISGLAQHGCGEEALELFRKMNADGVKPNGASFVAVLSACCHAGLLDDGRRLFLAMKHDYGIEPTVVHCNCMVDLLGRAGRLEEAKNFIQDMGVEPDAVTWLALLGGCRTYRNVESGEFAAKEILKLEPRNSSAHVLLSNIYAAAGEWGKVSSVRRMMQARGVWKEPGRSWIEVDSKIHEFVVGDTSHPEAKAIYMELSKLTEKLKAEGYVPDTQLVLHDIDEEDKELALCSHSEKLAIVYGLMRTPRDKPIRVYKNLRVCSDCHSATRLISKVTGREIIARDCSRFHHFKDGVCSCGDYW